MTPLLILKNVHATATTSLLFQAHLGNADIISSYVWQPCNQHQQESRKIYASEKNPILWPWLACKENNLVNY